jgi:hypothetical protein
MRSHNNGLMTFHASKRGSAIVYDISTTQGAERAGDHYAFLINTLSIVSSRYAKKALTHKAEK